MSRTRPSVGIAVPFGARNRLSVRVFVVDHENVALAAEGVVLASRLALRAGGHAVRPNTRMCGEAATFHGYVYVANRRVGFRGDRGGRDSQRQCRGKRGAERGFFQKRSEWGRRANSVQTK